MKVVKIKKQKAQRNVIYRELQFENYKNSLQETQLDHKINYLEQNEINEASLKEDHKEIRKKQ